MWNEVGHIWGDSPAADEVLSLIVGLREGAARRARLVVLQAFIDDSYDAGGAYVLAGYVADTRTWAQFSAEWEAYLPRFGTLAPDGSYHFKMAEMATSRERHDRVPHFIRLIENHRLIGIACGVFFDDLREGVESIVSPAHLTFDPSPSAAFKLCFQTLQVQFNGNRANHSDHIESDGEIQFVFDTTAGSAHILQEWNASDPPMGKRHMYRTPPVFRDDRHFLPLQAADFLAWHCRSALKKHGRGAPVTTVDVRTTEGFSLKRPLPLRMLTLGPENVAESLHRSILTDPNAPPVYRQSVDFTWNGGLLPLQR